MKQLHSFSLLIFLNLILFGSCQQGFHKDSLTHNMSDSIVEKPLNSSKESLSVKSRSVEKQGSYYSMSGMNILLVSMATLLGTTIAGDFSSENPTFISKYSKDLDEIPSFNDFIQSDTDGNIYLVGTLRDIMNGDYRLFTTRFDIDGNEVWSHITGSDDFDIEGKAIFRLNPDRNVILGNLYGAGGIVETFDPGGLFKSIRTLNISDISFLGGGVVNTALQNVFACGNGEGDSGLELRCVKLHQGTSYEDLTTVSYDDSDIQFGNVLWHNGLVFASTVENTDDLVSNTDILVTKLDTNRVHVRSCQVGINGTDDFATSIKKTDSGYLIGGGTGDDQYLFEISDSACTVNWARQYVNDFGPSWINDLSIRADKTIDTIGDLDDHPFGSVLVSRLTANGDEFIFSRVLIGLGGGNVVSSSPYNYGAALYAGGNGTNSTGAFFASRSKDQNSVECTGYELGISPQYRHVIDVTGSTRSEDVSLMVDSGVSAGAGFTFGEYLKNSFTLNKIPVCSATEHCGVGISNTPAPTVDTLTPTGGPTGTPSEGPTGTPSKGPTGTPSESPTGTPSESPTGTPSEGPTGTPSKSPTFTPTVTPSFSPSVLTLNPTVIPTDGPIIGTLSPTFPSLSPSNRPTEHPTFTPSIPPTKRPTEHPTSSPTKQPTFFPTDGPTSFPSEQTLDPTTGSPTEMTDIPSKFPTSSPTDHPSKLPSFETGSPTSGPTLDPTVGPTLGEEPFIGGTSTTEEATQGRKCRSTHTCQDWKEPTKAFRHFMTYNYMSGCGDDDKTKCWFSATGAWIGIAVLGGLLSKDLLMRAGQCISNQGTRTYPG